MKFRRACIIGLAGGIVCATSGAARADDSVTVGDVRVEGNDRTGTAVILRAAEVPSGSSFSDDLCDEVRQRVYNLRVFDTVAVEPARHGDRADLTIRVSERWTLLPIPFASGGAGYFKVGGLVVDSNFLGSRKIAALGAVYGNRGSGGFIYYHDPEIAGSRWEAVVEASYFSQLRQRYDAGAPTYAFNEKRAEVFPSLGYRLARPLVIFGGWGVTKVSSEAAPGFPMPPAEDGWLHGPTLDVNVDATDFRLYFQEGVQNQLRLETSFAQLGAARSYLRVTDHFQAATSTFADHALIASADLRIETSDALTDSFLVGGQTGTRGFHNQGLWATRLATAALEYHVPVWRPRWGVWTVLGFVDGGVLDGVSGKVAFVQPGAGFRLFVRKVALPAVGLDITYSLEERSLWTAVSLGLKM